MIELIINIKCKLLIRIQTLNQSHVLNLIINFTAPVENINHTIQLELESIQKLIPNQ